MKFNNISTVIEDYIDFTDARGMVDRAYIKKIAHSVLKKLQTNDMLKEEIVKLVVKDYRAKGPDDLEKIIQIAANKKDDRKVRITEVVEWSQRLYDGSGCKFIVKKDCSEGGGCDNESIVVDVDRDWELTHPEYRYGYMKHFYRHGGLLADNNIASPFHPGFVLVKPAQHSFWNADLFIPGCLNLNTTLLANTSLDFKIDQGHNNIFTFNFKEGECLLAYLAIRTDSEGYRMIPDIEEVYDAVKWNVIELMLERDRRKAVTNADRSFFSQLLREARAERKSAMAAADEVLNTPDFQSWWNFLEQNYFKMMKDVNSVNKFNAKLPDDFDNTMNRLNSY